MLWKQASELRWPDSGQDPVLPSEDQSGGPERSVYLEFSVLPCSAAALPPNKHTEAILIIKLFVDG